MTGRDDATLVDDRHVIAQSLYEAHDVGRQHDGATARSKGPQHLLDKTSGDRVNGLERLVQDEHLRRMEQRAGDQDLLRHAGGVIGDGLGGGIRKPECLEELHGATGGLILLEAAQGAQVVEIFRAGKPVEDGSAVHEHTDGSLGGQWILPDGMARDKGRAVVRAQQAARHGEHGGLACAVGTHHAVNGAARDVEAQVLDRGAAVKGLGEIAHRKGAFARVGR